VQVAWDGPTGGIVIIDPLALDIAPFAAVLAGDGVMIAHAADQDLEVLERACGRLPSVLLDTQVAAGFAGQGSASLAALSRAFLGADVPKADRLTDWRRRPLTESQLAYAAADVENLIQLADAISGELRRDGRFAWAQEECEMLRSRPHGPGDPSKAWWKLRDARSLRGQARGVAQEVAAWRELRAQAVDHPVRTVLPDLAVTAIAHRPPANPKALSEMRGLEGRSLRPDAASELLEAIARGKSLPPERLVLPPADDVPKELRASVSLLMAWIAQVARDQRIDATLLATRGDVAALVRGDRDGRLSRGWREEMVARGVQSLMTGNASLAFGSEGRLMLEERSRRPLGEQPKPDPVQPG